MKRLLIAVVLLTALTACSSSTDVAPTETIAAKSSVVDAVSFILVRCRLLPLRGLLRPVMDVDIAGQSGKRRPVTTRCDRGDRITRSGRQS